MRVGAWGWTDSAASRRTVGRWSDRAANRRTVVRHPEVIEAAKVLHVRAVKCGHCRSYVVPVALALGSDGTSRTAPAASRTGRSNGSFAYLRLLLRVFAHGDFKTVNLGALLLKSHAHGIIPEVGPRHIVDAKLL